MAAYRQAIALNPRNVIAHDNLLCAMQVHPAYDDDAIGRELIRWRERHADPLKQEIRVHANNRDHDRRLRIGYVSPDFREHPVGRYLLPLLANHDHKRFEVICYADLAMPDQITEKLRPHADQWRTITGMSDKNLAELIRQDQIDILVDLTMHTNGNRLLTFARKPAPVQVA